MATVPDDQLTAWADQVHIASSWVSGVHHKKLLALAKEITAWGNPEPPGDGEQSADLEAPSPAPSATDVDGEFVDLQ